MSETESNDTTGKKGSSSTVRVVGIAVAVVVVVAVIVALLIRGGGDDNSTQQEDTPAASSSAPKAPEQDEQEESTDTADNLPGAAVGNKQRTWPSFDGKYDDSAHATPGKTSASWSKQRPVWTPNNHDGDFPKRSDLKESMGQCDKPDSISLNGKTQQQYVNARYLVVNNEAGPTKSVRGIPRGYAHSPQGAVIAAINAVAYGAPDAGDEVGFEAEEQLWTTSKSAMELQEERSARFDNEQFRAELVEPADGFKVRTCSDDLVVVEVVSDFENGENIVARVPMAWRDGDWVPDMSGTGDDQLTQDSRPLSEFTKVEYR